MSVTDWHDRLLEAALDVRKSDPAFRFNMRSRNDERLARGYWFLGNEGYLFLPPFWPNDSINKTRTVGFCVGFDELGHPKSCYLILVFRSVKDPKHLKVYQRMASELGPFVRKRPDELRRYYMVIDPELSFREFLAKDYPRLLNIIREEGVEDEFLVPENEFTSMLDRVQRVRARS